MVRPVILFTHLLLLAVAIHAQTYTVLNNMKLNGTTSAGPNPTHGTFYKVNPSGTSFQTLYRFDLAHGQTPLAITLGTDGNFYGTSESGGQNDAGAIFELTPAGKPRVLHSFSGSQGDGFDPVGPIMQASDGNLYGTIFGGKFLYKIKPSGAGFNTFFT